MDQYTLKELDLEERKSALLSLLTQIEVVLSDNNIMSFAYYGTLLGCIRHEGFIPWDDDIDLAMLREDYNRLKNIDWREYGLEIQSPQVSNNCPYALTKIIDPNYVYTEAVQSGDVANGLNIDIFPIDAVPHSSFDLSVHFVRFMCLMRNFKVVTDKADRSRSKSLLLKIGRALLRPVSVGTISKNIDTYSQGHETSATNRVGCIAGPYRQRELLAKSLFSDFVLKKFETLELLVPKEFDRILNELYGDYMKLPPANQRVTHHASTVFRKIQTAND